MLASSARRAATSSSSAVVARRRTTAIAAAAAATSALGRRTYATPSGPPPKGFRLPREPNWDEEKESTLDRIGHFFLMTEMARGMYVLMEQFFRPP
jgi:NADH dehydrogenase (ubiquinone) Fe-S protein 8